MSDQTLDLFRDVGLITRRIHRCFFELHPRSPTRGTVLSFPSYPVPRNSLDLTPTRHGRILNPPDPFDMQAYPTGPILFRCLFLLPPHSAQKLSLLTRSRGDPLPRAVISEPLRWPATLSHGINAEVPCHWPELFLRSGLCGKEGFASSRILISPFGSCGSPFSEAPDVAQKVSPGLPSPI